MTIHFNDITETAQDAAFIENKIPALQRFYRDFGKRFFDVSLIVLTAFASIPIILLAAFIVSLDGSSPFFRQKRVGKDNRVFYMWKLRTMVPNAEERLVDYLAQDAEARREWDAFQKLKDDPRITRIGRILRKTSLDELPQFFNVLRGEMSLIGPRPMMLSQTALYPGTAYYKLRPGISGFWQVSDRNDSEFKSRALFDVKYHRAVSLWTDLKIIFATFTVVFKCTGH